jgi:membrane protein DedA with SNARE-associated domain
MAWPLWLAAGTLMSEDAATLSAAWLVRQGELSATTAIVACGAGIWVGDLGLWLAGRVLRRFDRVHRWCVARAPLVAGRALTLAADEPLALLASRFLPGTRLPLYLTAGALGTRPWAFALWTLAAVALWTPLVVLGASWWLGAGVAALVVLRVLQGDRGRRWLRLARARLERWTHPEFWPTPVLYAPLAPWLLWQVVRHGGPGTVAAANPGFEDGGFVGESKAAILGVLPDAWTVPFNLVPPGALDQRVAAFDRALAERGWTYPIILKPDVGQKGVGVRRVLTRDEVERYLGAESGAVIVQPYHPGPYEVGIFYVRRPDEARGRIFSITDKRFPFVVGDGLSTLEELLWAHPRFRLQVPLFLKRHDGARVPADGERVALVTSGNHCQGAIFLDGQALKTRGLEARIDQIARAVPGFFVGRFDVRYSDPARFARGEDLAIVELNGVTSESTNIYDPAFGPVDAWRTLMAQWRLVFEIGAANRARGARAPSPAHLAARVIAFWRRRPAMPIAS